MTASQKREFLRLVFREGAPDAASRAAYLDGLATKAMAAQTSGKTLSSSSSEGVSASYLVFNDWRPDVVLSLIDWARDYVGMATVENALAQVLRPIRSYSAHCGHLTTD